MDDKISNVKELAIQLFHVLQLIFTDVYFYSLSTRAFKATHDIKTIS